MLTASHTYLGRGWAEQVKECWLTGEPLGQRERFSARLQQLEQRIPAVLLIGCHL